MIMINKFMCESGIKIGSDEWKRRPACNCNNCINFFNLCKKIGYVKALEEYNKLLVEKEYKYFLGLRIRHDFGESINCGTFTDLQISKEEAIRIRNLINNCLEKDKDQPSQLDIAISDEKEGNP